MFSTTAIAASKHCYQFSSINRGGQRPKGIYQTIVKKMISPCSKPRLLKPEREHDQARITNNAKYRLSRWLKDKKKKDWKTYNGST
jgi:hypothetical protein